MKNKKINNRELIINSLNNEFDNRGIKKYTKKELKNMISLEDFILKYYDRYNIVVIYRDFFHIDILNRFSRVKLSLSDEIPCLFNGRFSDDIEVVKFIDEFRLDEIYLEKFRLADGYEDQDIFIDLDEYNNIIFITISRLLLREAV